jgi:hypothetical protein
MHAPSTDSKDYPRPLEISEEDFEEGRAFRLHVAKFSAGKRERQPVWVLRRAENPWRFETFGVQDPKGLSESRQKTHETRAVRLVWEYVKGHQDNAPMTKTGLRALKIGGLTEKDIRTAVERALASGYLVEAILPSEQQATRRKTGLRTGRMEPPKA